MYNSNAIKNSTLALEGTEKILLQIDLDRNGALSKMEEIVGKALANSFHKRLAYLEGKKIIKAKAKINEKFIQ